jgi:hypothetical protein
MGLADKAIAALVRGGRIGKVIERQFANKVAGPIGRKMLTPQPLIPKRHLNKTSAIVPRWYMMPKDIRYAKDGNEVTNAYFGGTDITKSLEKGQGIPWGTQASEWNLLRRKMAEESGKTPNIINDNPLTDTSWQWRDNARLAGVPKGPDMRPYGEAERAKGKQVLGATALAAGSAKKAIDYFSNLKDSYRPTEEKNDG